MSISGATSVRPASFWTSPLGRATEIGGGVVAGGGIAFGLSKLLGKSTGSSWRIAGLVAAAAGVSLLLGGCGSTGGSSTPTTPSNPIPPSDPTDTIPTTPSEPTTPSTPSTPSNPSTGVPEPVTIPVKIANGEQHAKKGADGEWHDAFMPADYNVRAGQQVTLTFENTDDQPHIMVCGEVGLSVTIPAGTPEHPGTATTTFTPEQPGDYMWMCAMPCDSYSMATMGFMMGTIHVTA